MKTQDIISICNFFDKNIENLNLTKSKKAEIKITVNIFHRSLKHKNPVEYLKDRVLAEQMGELIKYIIDFHKKIK